MNNAHNYKPAGFGANGGRLARLARLGVIACVLAGAGTGALAQNQERDPRRDEAAMRERYQMQAQQEQRFDPRAYEMRDQDRRAMEVQSDAAREERRRGRMSADERRDLRRQIREGAELYPNARRR
ncbi:hypothetical protein ABIB38_001451 [Massilia sp. UYP11]|uniref:hypothetical protein n=1 Tax=Massilia sp. UYP11 TaxID=1756385 RepID=UPI003D1CF167